MYGVPADIPIQPFVGHELNQICLGRFQIRLHCSGVGTICMEAHWELRDETGALVDSNEEHSERKSFRIHRVIDVPIARYRVDPPKSFTLFFENDFRLTVFDDSEQYESFSIHIEGQPSLYI